MLRDPVDAQEETSPAALRSRYEAALVDVVSTVGADAVSEATGLGSETVATIERGNACDVDLDDAVAILSLQGDAADPETIRADVRDRLLLEMSAAMLTVDRIADEIEGDLDPKEVQAKIEGRYPMTLSEYARLRYAIAANRR